MHGKVEKNSNESGVAAYRKTGDGEIVRNGPTYIVTVPESYNQQEMEEIADLAMSLPDTSMGNMLVVREGVQFTKISDGQHFKMSTLIDKEDDKQVYDDWG